MINKLKNMNLDKNKKNAISFYKTAYKGNPEKAVELYIGKEYIQHNPDVEDGTKDSSPILKECKRNIPTNQ